ncbi:MAG: ftsE [Paucimonas sp.]|nr:ftsE [Paucimonas sp.]
MIVFEQVSKDYAGSAGALRDVSLQIKPGELVFLTGPSGAGKSTLLKLAAAIEKPTRGAVMVGGQDVGRLPPAALPYLRRKLGLVLQPQRLLQDRSVLENVMLPLLVAGAMRPEAAKRALAALEKVGLAHKSTQAPASLSGGEQQRAAIARAVVHRPQLILADEPTANLDRANGERVMDLLRTFHHAGVTCVIATHDEQFLHGSDRTVALAQGCLVQPAGAAA